METPTIVLNGMALAGLDEATGVRWLTERNDIGGWDSSPTPRLSMDARPRGHGVWVGESWLAARTVTVTGWMEAPSNEAGADAMDRLAAACTLEDGPLTVDDRTAAVRRSDQVLVNWKQRGKRVAQWSIQLLAADPRRTAAALSGSTGLPATSGGLTIPFTLPTTISAVTVSGQVSLTNLGNIAGPVTLRIDGPITGPIVTHVNSGRQLIFAASLALGAGEFVTVDMDRREVLAQGQSSRNGWITSRGWSSFEIGSNTWAFTSAGGVPGGLLTVTAVPTWM